MQLYIFGAKKTGVGAIIRGGAIFGGNTIYKIWHTYNYMHLPLITVKLPFYGHFAVKLLIICLIEPSAIAAIL